MATPWFRVWGDMINDPKWRTIARVSQQKIGDVIAVYVHMLTSASNATERGRTQGWNDEDIGTALDIETNQVAAIRDAMQGRVLDGNHLSGWEKRQPVREDGSSDRGKAFRERQKQEKEASQTLPNATERNRTLDKIREEEIREEQRLKTKEAPAHAKKAKAAPPAAMPDFFDGVASQVVIDFKAMRSKQKAAITKTAIDGIQREADRAGLSLEAALTLCCERGWRGFNADWVAAPAAQARASPGYQTPNDKARAWADQLTGTKNEPNFNCIDINAVPRKMG